MYHLMYCIMYHQKTHVIKCLEKKHAAALVIHYIIQHGDNDLLERIWKCSKDETFVSRFHMLQNTFCM